MFESTPLNPPDAIFGLMEEFRRDDNQDKINLTVGMYQDETGRTPILKSVRLAEQRILDQAASHTYLPIDGIAEFNRQMPELLLGPDHQALTQRRIRSAQTPGGTGALRVAGELLRRVYGVSRIWVTSPTWSNHLGIFRDAGLEILPMEYLNDSGTALDFANVERTLESAMANDAVLLHTVCHNPTGFDPSVEQWTNILDKIRQRNAIPIFDFAYQGFGENIDVDAFPIRSFCKEESEALICNSFSKSFNLYGERVGAISCVTANADQAESVMSQIKAIIRTIYSNPPTHGGSIVSTVLGDDELRGLWVSELDEMRVRLMDLRKLFVEKIAAALPDVSFEHVLQQRGMFSYSGINRDAVAQLKRHHSIYLLASGRINIAGINSSNVDRLCEAIAAVMGATVGDVNA